MPVALPARAPAFPHVGGTVKRGTSLDVLIVGVLVGAALAVRWPELLLSPQFPSVGATVLRALDIADGHAFHLADQAPYLGSVFIYLLAAVYKLFGPSVQATQLVPWALGGLTVVPTYLLGRELGGRVAGFVAGALLATSPAHTVVSSHVPLSHSLTPLLATATLWLLARAVIRGDGRSLALAGLGAGLSLQTHPTVAPLLLGAAGAALLQRPELARTRWPYLTLGLLLLGYSTLLAHHVRSGFEIVADVQGKQARYLDADVDAGEAPERGIYLNNLEQLLVSLARLTSGAIDERKSSADYLRDPRVLAYSAAAAAGLLLAARRGNLLLVLALLPAIFLPPLLSGKYKPILDGRYLMPLVPVLFVGVGLLFGAAARGLGSRWARPAAVAALALLAALLVLPPLGRLAEFYKESREDGFSNADYLQTLDQLRVARSGDEPGMLDPRLRGVKSPGGGTARSSFAWVLAVSRVPSQSWSEGDGPRALVGRLAILHRATAERLGMQLTLTPLDGRRSNGRDRQSYRAYRVG